MNKILPAIAIVAIISILVISLGTATLSASCSTTSTPVDASESPEKDVNQNGIICKTERQTAQASLIHYQDDM